MDAFGDNSEDTGLRPGDMITFNDSSNSNHKKAYKVTKVTNNTDYLSEVNRLLDIGMFIFTHL